MLCEGNYFDYVFITDDDTFSHPLQLQICGEIIFTDNL